jgi:uncharacterized surface protein with fasciclin (FAS1) repeats
MNKRYSVVALLAVFALLVAACSSSEAAEETTTTSSTTTTVAEQTSVLDLAVEAGQFSTLIAAVEAAGLGDTLEGEGPFTVLAPTDAAFAEALTALDISAEDLLADTETLTAILTYHVLPEAADSQLVAALDGQSVATVNGQSIQVSVVDGQILVDEATVVSADLRADNGIVHVINGVLLPPDVAAALGAAAPEEATTTTTEAPADPTIAEIVAELAAGDPAEFTVLLAAVQAADPAVAELLSDPDASVTVFAPTDAAFAALLEELGLSAEELLASEDLTNILLYHVVDGAVLANDVIAIAPADVPTLLDGQAVAVAVVDGNVVVNEVATVTQPDVTAGNGVVHIIDAVLVPSG